jgi:diguanylate cyclase (GGDEF)-like protein
MEHVAGVGARVVAARGALLLGAAIPSAVLGWRSPSILAWTAAAGAAAAVGVAFGLLIWSDRERTRARAMHKSLGAEIAALERKIREQGEALNQARTIDETTGVLKRNAFLERFQDALARDARLEKPLALLLLDIEGFREINEKHGRKVGDDALAAVARSLKSATRGTDVVGRVGDDELAVVLGERADPRPAIDRLFLTLDALRVGEGDVRVRVAIGAALVEDPQEGWDLPEIVREAEVAVRAVHGRGGGVCETRRLRRERARSILA